MVAFAKPHLKPHTRCGSAKDSGRRYYSPDGVSRWLSRDPIGERGVLEEKARLSASRGKAAAGSHTAARSTSAAYQFLSNDPVDRIDPIGLDDYCGVAGTCPAPPAVAYKCKCPSLLLVGKKHKDNYIKDYNGCSVPGFIQALLPGSWDPNNPMGQTPDWIKVCNKHDCCYGTCNSSKSACDAEFTAGLNLVCSQAAQNMSFGQQQFLEECHAFVALYGLGVSLGGGPAYLENQARACKPCCCLSPFD